MVTLEQALESIKTGHIIYAPTYAEEVCDAFGVSFPQSLVQWFESDRYPMGATMFYGPEDGVWSLALARHVAQCFGVTSKAQGFIGRGSQAREYARLVAEYLENDGR